MTPECGVVSHDSDHRINTELPDISVVIPCRNGDSTLGQQLDALLSQETSFQFEVIVADNGSTDGTAEIVRRYGLADRRIRIVDASRAPGINVARNSGASEARGSFVVLCDADDVVHPGWLEAYGQAFKRGARCVGGSVDRELPDGSVLQRQRVLPLTNFSSVPYPIGANCGFTKAVFSELQGFDESFSGGSDEIEFFWRAHLRGHVTHHVPGAVISYRVRPAGRQLWLQYYRYGQGNARLLNRFGTARQVRREQLLAPIRWLRAVAVFAASRPGSPRRRGGIEQLGFQWGMSAAGLARLRLLGTREGISRGGHS
jgi:glycosyltransferase involved in cell wall biosynthesis